MKSLWRSKSALVVVMLSLMSACGGSGSATMTNPSPGTGPVGASVTITASGVSPKAVTINAGEVVMFVNSDTRNHQMDSNPHPEHTDCPGINALDVLAAGQSRNTANLTTPRTCGVPRSRRFIERQSDGNDHDPLRYSVEV